MKVSLGRRRERGRLGDKKWVIGLANLCLGTVILDWEEGDTEMAGGKPNLWEESWDDDDSSEDFSAQLR